MELLSIGTILEVNNRKLCIMGYTGSDEGQFGYCTVPYPIGYLNLEKTFFIPLDLPVSVLASGYETEDSRKLLTVLSNFIQLSQKVPAEQLPQVMAKYKAAVNALRKEGKL